jgi:hypothetical protein
MSQSPSPSDPELYLKKHYLMSYIEDAVTFLLERKEEDPKTNPYKLLAEYFESIRKGTHVLYRDYSFVSLTPHSRASFVRLFWYSFSEVADRGDSMRVMEYLSLLRLLCHDFPSRLVQKVARVVFSYDALENMVNFSDFLYTFQVVFYYETYLQRCEVVCADIVSGQTPLNLLDGASTVVVSMPSTDENECPSTRPNTANSVHSTLSTDDIFQQSTPTHKQESPLQPDIFMKAVTNVCLRMEKEPWECCPSIPLVVEIVADLACVTFYDFVLALSRSEQINKGIGVLPERSNLLTAERSAVFNQLTSKRLNDS